MTEVASHKRVNRDLVFTGLVFHYLVLVSKCLDMCLKAREIPRDRLGELKEAPKKILRRIECNREETGV